MELIDWFTIVMSPIDEVFCRMRNHKGLNESPIVVCPIKIRWQTHWFINALGEVGEEIWYRGVYSWTGTKWGYSAVVLG